MIIHQILSGNFNYNYYLSVVSALNVHKYTEYNLWVIGDIPLSPYLPILSNKINIRKADLSFLGIESVEDAKKFAAFTDKPDRFINVHLKDLVAWNVLYEYGGLFMDLDTLSIKDCSSFYDECETSCFFSHCKGSNAYNVAVMVAKPNAEIIKVCRDIAIDRLNNFSFNWADTGPCLLTQIVNDSIYADMFDMLIPVGICDNEISDDVTGWFEDNGSIWNNCHILHTFGSGQYAKGLLIDEKFIYISRSPYAKLVKTLLEPDVWNPLNKPKPQNGVRKIKTFHIMGLSHTPTNKVDSLSCAYTQKVIKLSSMLKSLGHTVYFYGIEDSDAECDENVQVLSRVELEISLGKYEDKNKFYNLDYNTKAQEIFNANTIQEINMRKSPKDFLLCPYGFGHKIIADAVQIPLTVESGIGYTDTFALYRVFESYTWMAHVYGRNKQDNGSNYDCVIPNYFDPKDFEFSNAKQDYILYLGRLIGRKGIEIAIQAAQLAKTNLIVAGQDCNENINLDRPYVTYAGYADLATRRELLKNAKALIIPTMYIPPFEGVHVEAWFSGTPVITSDWGVFGETVQQGINGYRCRTMDHYVWAIQNIDKLRSSDCHSYALNNFSMDRIKWMYDEYFDMLYDLVNNSKAYYEIHNDRADLDWLCKH